MEIEQIDALYEYLIQNTDAPQTLLDGLNRGRVPWDNPENSMLYLPMFSMGMSAGAISPRIEWLRDYGWNLTKLAESNFKDRDEIAIGTLEDGSLFGMRPRIDALALRAQQISALDPGELEAILTPPANWEIRDLFRPLRILQRFRGVGLTAAFHILMELNWGVVKPDRHICRFLSRIGGQWSQYFQHPGDETVNSEASLFLIEAWRDACLNLGAQRERIAQFRQRAGVHFPDITELSSRQIDLLIMGYTQKTTARDRNWRPNPICTANPQCHICIVPNCAARVQLDPG